MIVHRDAGQRRGGLSLAPGGEENGLLRLEIAKLARVEDEIIGLGHMAERTSDFEIPHQAAAHYRGPTAQIVGSRNHLADARDIGGKHGDDDAAFRFLHDPRQRLGNQPLGGRAAGLLDSGGV